LMDQQRKGRILVLAVGNVLLGDEGVGIHAFRKLRERSLPPQVDVVDGGTAGVDLLGLMEGYQKVVIVDAVDAREEPGTIFRFTPADMPSEASAVALSLHQAELLEVLSLAAYLGRDLPPIVIYGVQPAEMGWSTELSAKVGGQLESLLDAIQAEVSFVEDSP
jgi:hydrogenase maturation protease